MTQWGAARESVSKKIRAMSNSPARPRAGLFVAAALPTPAGESLLEIIEHPGAGLQLRLNADGTIGGLVLPPTRLVHHLVFARLARATWIPLCGKRGQDSAPL